MARWHLVRYETILRSCDAESRAEAAWRLGWRFQAGDPTAVVSAASYALGLPAAVRAVMRAAQDAEARARQEDAARKERKRAWGRKASATYRERQKQATVERLRQATSGRGIRQSRQRREAGA